MRTLIQAIVLCLLVLGQAGVLVAHAQNEVCPVIASLVQAAPDGLQDLRGTMILAAANDPDGQDQCCYANKNMPGAGFCTVKDSLAWAPGTRYTCIWSLHTRQEAESAFNAFASSVKACLPPDVWQDESSNGDLQFRASLQNGYHQGKISLSINRSRAYVSFIFEAFPRSAKRRH